MKLNLSFVDAVLKRFFFSPRTAHPIAALRVLLGVALLVQAFLIAPDFLELYGPDGILQSAVARAFRHSYFAFSFSEVLLTRIGIVYMASLIFLILGAHTRLAAVSSWLCHMLLVGGHFTTYGVDSFAHIFLFYLAIFPSGAEWSWDRFSGRAAGGASSLHGFALRVLQLHLCLIYTASGIEKALGPQWQSGEVIWRALMLPIYQQYDFAWLAQFPGTLKMLAWGTLVLEIGYPLFMWTRRLRPIGVVLILSLHLGISIFLGLGVFSSVMGILTFSLFGVGGDWMPRFSFNRLPDTNVALPPAY